MTGKQPMGDREQSYVTRTFCALTGALAGFLFAVAIFALTLPDGCL